MLTKGTLLSRVDGLSPNDPLKGLLGTVSTLSTDLRPVMPFLMSSTSMFSLLKVPILSIFIENSDLS